MKLATALVTSILSLMTLDARGAAPTDDAYTVTVPFADLDLRHQDGIAELYGRIQGAARRVCAQQADEQRVEDQDFAGCVKRAVSTAVARIDRPMLSEYAAQLGGKPAKTARASLTAPRLSRIGLHHCAAFQFLLGFQMDTGAQDDFKATTVADEPRSSTEPRRDGYRCPPATRPGQRDNRVDPARRPPSLPVLL